MFTRSHPQFLRYTTMYKIMKMATTAANKWYKQWNGIKKNSTMQGVTIMEIKLKNMMKLVAQDGMRDNNVAVYYRVISILRQIYIWKLTNNTEVILINSKN